jgi:hypothetical protein|mmetsp:Transcript_2589/g.4799  ORF Transcript_2589/g.4799 Transcript_2589/m.4799 type:complete len:246 (+) Transcript_2589:1896-2633(+)
MTMNGDFVVRIRGDTALCTVAVAVSEERQSSQTEPSCLSVCCLFRHQTGLCPCTPTPKFASDDAYRHIGNQMLDESICCESILLVVPRFPRIQRWKTLDESICIQRGDLKASSWCLAFLATQRWNLTKGICTGVSDAVLCGLRCVAVCSGLRFETKTILFAAMLCQWFVSVVCMSGGVFAGPTALLVVERISCSPPISLEYWMPLVGAWVIQVAARCRLFARDAAMWTVTAEPPCAFHSLVQICL